MAHSLSSKKRIRQNEKQRLRNRMRRSALRTVVRKSTDVLTRGTPDAAAEQLRLACKTLDRAANQGTIHRNAAARRKSRLMRRLNGLRQKAAAAK